METLPIIFKCVFAGFISTVLFSIFVTLVLKVITFFLIPIKNCFYVSLVVSIPVGILIMILGFFAYL